MSTNFYLLDSEDQNYWEGIFLGKRAFGWVFQIKWHDYSYCSCDCPNDTHNYRNWDEFKEFVQEGIIIDEYRETHNAKEFISMIEERNTSDNRVPSGTKDTWRIDNYYFVRGNWC